MRILLLLCLALKLTLALTFVPAHAGWRAGTPLPTAVPAAIGASLDNQIYVMSGALGTGLRSFFELYDVARDGWRPLTPLPVQLSHFALAAGGGRLYLSGGRNHDDPDAAGDIWIYAPEVAIWVRRAPMPSPRAGHASVVADGKLFLLGGVNAFLPVQSYDIARDTWRTWNAPMPVPVAHSAAVVWGDEIVLVGGLDANGRDVATVQALHIQRGTWRRLPDLPQAASGVAVSVLKNKLHVVGGYAQAQQSVLDTHIRLVGNAWQSLSPMVQGRHQMAAASVDNQLVLIGGAFGGGFYAMFTASNQVSIYEERP